MLQCISLFHRAFQFTMCFGPNNALVFNETLNQMSHIKTLKITPTCFDHQLIIRELLILFKITG
jgi:arginine exporter protein ArgO